MNLRILKKLSKKAMPLLIGMRDGFLPANFYPAEKGENYHGLDLRGRRWPDGSTGVVSCHPLKGTMMHGFDSDDFVERTAWELLWEVVHWAHVDDGPCDEEGLPLFPLRQGVVLDVPADYLRLARLMVAARNPSPTSAKRSAAPLAACISSPARGEVNPHLETSQ